jgi:2-oxoglutarate ferredoxin oxidoreductase subunit gamma
MSMNERNRIVFSGSGGQGVITAAVVLAEAAVMFEDLNAVQSQSYGPEARGGATRSDVIISDSEIFFPKVLQPNVLICLTQTAYDKYHQILRPGGILISDTHFVNPDNALDAQRCELPLYKTVIEKIGKPVVFNIALLGALIAIQPLVSREAIMSILKMRLPWEFTAVNQLALDLGYELGGKCACEQ